MAENPAISAEIGHGGDLITLRDIRHGAAMASNETYV
jgi:hypothetical protein